MKLNPANYTAWHFRRECLKRLVLETPTTTATKREDEDKVGENQSMSPLNDNKMPNNTIINDAIEQELDLATALGGSNPKNYQVWLDRVFRVCCCGGGSGDGVYLSFNIFHVFASFIVAESYCLISLFCSLFHIGCRITSTAWHHDFHRSGTTVVPC